MFSLSMGVTYQSFDWKTLITLTSKQVFPISYPSIKQHGLVSKGGKLLRPEIFHELHKERKKIERTFNETEEKEKQTLPCISPTIPTSFFIFHQLFTRMTLSSLLVKSLLDRQMGYKKQFYYINIKTGLRIKTKRLIVKCKRNVGQAGFSYSGEKFKCLYALCGRYINNINIRNVLSCFFPLSFKSFSTLLQVCIEFSFLSLL